MVIPLVSRIAVLIAGRPIAAIVWKDESAWPPTCARTVRGPRAFVVRPEEEVREYLHALPREPRHRQRARVEERAEEGGEEHDLGEDEPHHSHAEGAVHLVVVGAVLTLADDGREPTEEHVGDQDRAGQERPAAGPIVKERDRAKHDGEQRDRAPDRPRAVVRYVVVTGVRGVCVCHGHFFQINQGLSVSAPRTPATIHRK